MLETINNSPLLREEWRKHVAVNRKDPVSSLHIVKIEEIQYTEKMLFELKFKDLSEDARLENLTNLGKFKNESWPLFYQKPLCKLKNRKHP